MSPSMRLAEQEQEDLREQDQCHMVEDIVNLRRGRILRQEEVVVQVVLHRRRTVLSNIER